MFCVTEYVTVPLPVPLAPPVIVAQPTAELAVHAQPACVVTATDPVDAGEPTVALVGEMLKVHAVAPAWVTVKVWPPIVSVALRLVVPVLAATA